jgi:hypothetical protein
MSITILLSLLLFKKHVFSPSFFFAASTSLLFPTLSLSNFPFFLLMLWNCLCLFLPFGVHIILFLLFSLSTFSILLFDIFTSFSRISISLIAFLLISFSYFISFLNSFCSVLRFLISSCGVSSLYFLYLKFN